ncbi:hypothetical protein CBW24_07920 [Pacificitalea manganoxidans]|uniref:Uncharacterized protein n=1 Tax=Pacificitalea manganoxidans TaxID=1411902 RepID=A0A291LZP5_9RHOB|nr:hypothetical protein [Pacificitalea manganoxidans]ATI41935.1 hypothetical protein CBW24_07920 [Pacificitalea manganoxidans]MDR6309422.1 hypothetical protein [Pacificitalea manganoxidans]OWU68252.1 hypothetical protein ATO2_12805 [Roseovarius sp. 22II1-1F6A]
MSALLAWVAGTRAGRALSAALTTVAALALALWVAFTKGKREAGQSHAREDHKRAEALRRRVQAARDHSRSDKRGPDERLREHGRLRD